MILSVHLPTYLITCPLASYYIALLLCNICVLLGQKDSQQTDGTDSGTLLMKSAKVLSIFSHPVRPFHSEVITFCACVWPGLHFGVRAALAEIC